MHLGLWQQRILIIVGLLLVVIPVIGLPVLFKNVFVVIAGLFLTVVILAGDNYRKPETSEQPTLSHQESATTVYQEVEPVVEKVVKRRATAKTSPVRRRQPRAVKTESVADYAEIF